MPAAVSGESDKKKYQDIADHMKDAIQKGIMKEDGSMPSDLMGAYVLPIYFDLVPEKHQETFAKNLVKSIEKNDMCMDTGFLATPYLLDALCKIGRINLAYTLMWQSKKPSWLYEVDAGFKHLLIAPKPDGKITSCQRSYETSQGTVVCDWILTKSEDTNIFSLHTVIPCNTVATIQLPDVSPLFFTAGNFPLPALLSFHPAI